MQYQQGGILEKAVFFLNFFLTFTRELGLLWWLSEKLMQDTWVRFLGREDPLEKGMATHSSILAWRIPWTEEPDWLQSTGLQSWTQLSD